MRKAVAALVSAWVILMACTSRGEIGDACTKSEDCEEDACSSDGYCSRRDCTENGHGCPAGWTCDTSRSINDAILGQRSSICVRPTPPATDAGSKPATCTLHEDDRCTHEVAGQCCGGACAVIHYDPSIKNGYFTCGLRCPATCKPGWSCHSFSATEGTDHPSGDFCLPDVPVVTIAQSPAPVAVSSEATLTATARSPAGLPLTEYRWTRDDGTYAGYGEVTKVYVVKSGETITLEVRDEVNQITTATISVLTQ